MAESHPPTIASLKRMRLTGVLPLCRDCRHSGAVAFETLRLPDETPFPRILVVRKFRCLACGSRDCRIAPDWRGYRASGMGK
jgi:hypothetical protein